jgi:prepilin-type N-terminal cleavage/methylation domain-containing protein
MITRVTGKNKQSSINFISHSSSPAFTIVELLVVIVVIGILAAITIVSYTGITQRATVATLQSDLTNASNQLKQYQVTNMVYPAAIDCSSTPAPNTICLKASSGNAFDYAPNNTANPPTYDLSETNTNGTVYLTTDGTTPAAISSTCPTGFIPVPGSSTYGTSNFCVMKYAASRVGSSNVPISQAGSLPWVNISQTTAIADAPNVANCSGCHLTTEAEWMTIVQNVLSVASNWSGGAVGSGYTYSGHSDDQPANALAPDSNDSNGYAGETNQGGNQRRTFALTNGQIIWDFSGNVREWTAGQTTGGQPGVSGVCYGFREWTAVNVNGGLTVSPFPGGTGLSGSNGWNSSKGIGMLYGCPSDNRLVGLVHSGIWQDGSSADGVLTLSLTFAPNSIDSGIGFRVSR